MIQYIDSLSDLKGKKILVRCDLNVPISDGKITNSFRIDKLLPTLDFLHLNGAKTILFSHITKNKEYDSLYTAFNYLNGLLPVTFSKTYFTKEAFDMVGDMEDGDILLFENIRQNDGEDSNDLEFAKKLSTYGEIFVNDAFSESHRKQASIVSLPKLLPHYGGLLMRQEIENLSKVFDPKKPFVFILGGAKFDTKLPIIKKFLGIADTVFIGGALAHNIYKARGFEIGRSLFKEASFDIKSIANNLKIVVPCDVTVKTLDGGVVFKKVDQVLSSDTILDAGPETITELNNILESAKTIVWNGPLGNFENGFADKTEKLAEIVAEMVKSGAESIVGGGDTLASIQKLELEKYFSFVSTGGGAMLDFLVDETLVGIEALK